MDHVPWHGSERGMYVALLSEGLSVLDLLHGETRGSKTMDQNVVTWPQWRCWQARPREIAVISCFLLITMLWLPERLSPRLCQALSWPCGSHTSERSSGSTCAREQDMCLLKSMLRPVTSITFELLCPELPPSTLGDGMRYLLVRTQYRQRYCRSCGCARASLLPQFLI